MNSGRTSSIVLLLFAVVLASPAFAAGEDWWDTDFTKCRDITLTNAGESALTDFPAYIYVPYDADMNADYSDIRFVDAPCDSNGAALDYEIEYYDANGADAWVSVDSIPAGGTTISIYYENPSASSSENPAATWGSSYASVYHLSHTSGDAIDSTGNTDASEFISPDSNMDSPGVVGKCDYLDGDDSLSASNWDLDSVSGVEHTYCAWVNYSGTSDMLIVEDGATAQGDGLGATSGKLRYAQNSGQTAVDSALTYNDNEWHYVCGAYSSSSELSLYVDGELIDSVSESAQQGAGMGASNTAYGNGVFASKSGNYFNGYLDEVRLSYEERGIEWINQTYQMVASQGSFVSLGSEESVGIVFWNHSTLDLGSAYIGGGAPSGPEYLVAVGSQENVTVACASGDCAVITDSWADGAGMGNGQASEVNFSCSDSTAGAYSAVFEVTSVEDATPDSINVSCEILQQEVAWDAPTLDLGSAYTGEGAPTGSRNITSTGPNTNVTVTCASGDCSIITDDWSVTGMSDAQSLADGFTCDDSTAGTYSAIFEVTSVEDASADSINVSCEILQQDVSWDAATLDMGSGYEGAGALSDSENVTSTGPNSNVTVTCASGDCAVITDDWSVTGMSDAQSLADGFTCSDSTAGTYSAVFEVTSVEDASADSINVTCEILVQPEVAWDSPTLDLGSGYEDAGDLTGSENVTSVSTNNNVTVTCASGDCSVITDDWSTTGMSDGQSLATGFTCIDSTAGTYSAMFEVTSVEDSSADSINVSCEILVQPEVAWDSPTLDLGSGYEGEGALGGSENVSSVSTNTNVTVTCSSGDCAVITDDWSVTSMSDGQSLATGFTCSDSSAGTYAAVFEVTSLEDATADSINVTCEILQQEVSWESSTLDLGSAYIGEGAPTGSRNITSTGPNTNVTVTCASGDCSIITDDWSVTGMSDAQSLAAGFTCDDSTAGEYSAVFEVTSVEDATPDSINVSCEILQQDVSWDAATLDMGSGYEGAGALSDSENVTSTGPNSNVTVTCASGDCAVITDDWSVTSMSDAQSLADGFTCDDSTAGTYSAIFEVTSVEDSIADSINVSCEILVQSQGLVVTLVSPANDSTDSDGDVAFECSATDDTGLKNVTLYGDWAGAGETYTEWIANNDSWKYNDSDSYPGSSWTSISFDDSSWPSGPGRLGYDTSGEEYLNTIVDIGSYPYPTYYFRKSFTLSDADAVTEMNFTIDYDDGYVVFINGYEVDRSSNMAGVDETDHEDLATEYHNWYCDSGDCGSGGSEPMLPEYSLTSTELEYLVDGGNTIAVLMKQSSTTSSDIAFMLSLYGTETEDAWGQIESKNITGTSNSTSFYANGFTNGTYEWNCLAYDEDSNSNWSESNYTFSVSIVPNMPPDSPTLVSPGDGSEGVTLSPTLDVIVTDADSDYLNVSFYGRMLNASSPPAENWTLVFMPDTQYYSESYPEIFTNQTLWIVGNSADLNLKAVMSGGDIVNVWNTIAQWDNANESLTYIIDADIPYLPSLGDHDHQGSNPDGATTYYEQYFPASRFDDDPWWGGEYNSNTNSYMLHTIEGDDYVMISMDFCPSDDEIQWVNATLDTYSGRKAILATHSFMDDTGEYYGTTDCDRWDAGGDTTYLWDALFKWHDNLQIVMNAHMHVSDGEYNKDVANINGVTIHLITADYQGRESGGNGRLRIMTFDPQNDQIYIQTYSPYTDSYETDADSQFYLDYNMSGSAQAQFEYLGSDLNVANGSHATFEWGELEMNSTYEWYAVVSDGEDSTEGQAWNFTTGSNVSLVYWNTPMLDLGSGLADAGDLEGSASVYSYNPNEGITVECTSGDCAIITEDWVDSTSMQDGQEVQVNFTCSDSAAGTYSAVFNLSSLNDTTPSQITVNCEVLPPSVTWNTSALDLGSGKISEGPLTGSAAVGALGNHSGVTVECVSGDCSMITEDWLDSTGMQDGQEFVANFTCLNLSVGTYSAVFNLTSSEDAAPDQLTVSCVISEDVDLWWDHDFAKCKDIAISSAGTGGLTNFPAYVDVAYDSDMNADYSDLRFVNTSCNNNGTELDYEIEYSNASSAAVWVEVDSIPAGGKTISMYYGSPNATTASNPAAVWDSDYAAIYHFNHTSGDLIDTQGNFDAPDHMSPESNKDVPGVTGRGDYFDGGDYFGDVTWDLDDTGGTPYAYCSWVRFTSTDLMVIAEDGAYQNGAGIGMAGGHLRFGVSISGSDYPQDSTDTYNDNAWHYICGVSTGSVVQLFVDGELDTYESRTSTIGTDTGGIGHASDTGDAVSGDGDSDYFFTGHMDELWLSYGARSADWINQSYQMVANQGTFAVFGSEQSYGAGGSSSVSWNQSALDLGSGETAGGPLTGSAQVQSSGANTNVAVTCISGNCSTITEDWVDTTGMSDGQSFQANFTCDNSTEGSFSAAFTVTSDEDSTPDQITVSCSIGEPSVAWASPTLDLGTGEAGEGTLTGYANIDAVGTHNNVAVSCASGDCSVITDDWVDTTGMSDGQSFAANFTCDDSAAGNFSAMFNVTSDEDSTPDQITVSCAITTPSIPVFCGFHAIHTTYSDGTMSPAQLVTNLKNNFDCGGTNDHDTMLSQSEWDDWLSIAESNNVDNNFTFFFGQEWSGTQHIYYVTMSPSSTQMDANDAGFNTADLLSEWLSNNQGIAQINHPARDSTGTDFSNPSQHNETWIPLVEMINRQSRVTYFHWDYYWECAAGSGCTTYQNPHYGTSLVNNGSTQWIRYALDNGIHLGFSCGNDDHGADPMSIGCYTGLANASNWTRQGVYDALQARHTWAAEEKTLMDVYVEDGGSTYLMGDIFESSTREVAISYEITASAGNTISNVSLFHNGVIVNVTSYSGQQKVSGTFLRNVTEGEEDYLFVEAIQSNGAYAWSSPMWITYEDEGEGEGDAPGIRFIQVTDTHINVGGSTGGTGHDGRTDNCGSGYLGDYPDFYAVYCDTTEYNNSAANGGSTAPSVAMEDTVEAINDFAGVNFTVFTGDLVAHEPNDTYKRTSLDVFKWLADGLDGEYYVLGAFYHDKVTEDDNFEEYTSRFGDINRNFTMEGNLFVILSESGSDSGTPSNNYVNLTYLDDVLSSYSDQGMTAFVFTHMPPSNQFFRGSNDPNFLSVLSSYSDNFNAIIVPCGHNHANEYHEINSVHYISTTASMNYPAEFRIFDIYDDRIEIYMSNISSPEIDSVSETLVNGYVGNGTLMSGATKETFPGTTSDREITIFIGEPDSVSWDAPTLNLGSGAEGAGDLTGSENVTSSGGNTDVTVTCASGDCSVITDDWVDTTDMSDSQSSGVGFTCSDSSAGSYSAVFGVTSDEDQTADTITVSCTIQGSGWWDSNFAKCKNINISNAGSAGLTNFPTYVGVAYDSDMKADYSDIRFVNAPCGSAGTALDYEIEYSNASSAAVWVEVDSIPAGGKTISMYYGNPSASSAHNPAAVWDSDYAAIYHFNHTSGGLIDTQGNFDVTDGMSPDSNKDVAGVTGRGDYFDGGDYFGAVSWDLDDTGSTAHAYCAWARFTSTDLMIIAEDGAYASGTGIGMTNGYFRFGVAISSTQYPQDSTSTYNDDAWHYVCGVSTGSEVQLYVDGELEASESRSAGIGSDDGGVGYGSGGSYGNALSGDSGDYFFTGYMDELWLSSEARSADWIKQSYEIVANQGTMVSFGDEESQP